MIWNEPLNKSTYMLYAIRHYNKGKGTWNDFFSDLRKFSLVSKCILIQKYPSENTPPIYHQTILNLIIKLANVFEGNSLARLLFFICSEDVHSEVKTYLQFIYRCPSEIPEVDLIRLRIDSGLQNLLPKI